LAGIGTSLVQRLSAQYHDAEEGSRHAESPNLTKGCKKAMPGNPDDSS